MQRRQRRTQVMRDVGHQLAPLQVLLAQLLPLFAQPLRHLRVRVLKDHQLVALAGAQRLRWRQWRRCVDVEGLDAPGQPPQRAGHPVERHQPGQQAEAANQHHRPPGGVPLATGGEVVGQHLPVLADQHHVHVTRLTALHDQRRGTEYLAAIRAARIAALGNSPASAGRAANSGSSRGAGGAAEAPAGRAGLVSGPPAPGRPR
ncbi:hypothetical protein G6F22_017857 [Rhizopus arrhizus]|nr:hypothetical protein G6F22_017857 [Rhizopus arrhizus]